MKKNTLLFLFLFSFCFSAINRYSSVGILQGNYSTIQSALDDCSFGDIVSLDAGTYIGSGNSGLVWPNIQNITLKGSTSANTILDAEGVTRHICINNGINLNLSNLSLINGFVPTANGSGASPVNTGGSIYIGVSHSAFLLEIEDVRISGNQARYGGAIGQNEDSYSLVSMNNVSIYCNSSFGQGGGFYFGRNNLANSEVYRNSGFFYGGGGFWFGINTLVNSKVYDNSASWGGGFNGGTNSLSNSSVNGNTATTGGGFYGTLESNTLSNCKVYSNRAAYGGGFYGGTNSLSNSSVSGNRAGGGGGFYGGTNMINNCEVYGNTATVGGGGFYSGRNNLANSEVYSNIASGNGGGFNDGTNSLSNSSVNGNTATTGGGFYSGRNNLANSEVYSNIASGNGGGFYDGLNSLNNSSVYGNTATYGGGFRSGTNTLANSAVHSNIASYGGGFSSGTNTLTNVLIYNNSASNKGAVFYNAKNKLINCTIVSNNREIYYDDSWSSGFGEMLAFNTIFIGKFNAGGSGPITLNYCALTDSNISPAINNNPIIGWITEDVFVDYESGDYRLATHSFFWNIGSTEAWNTNSNNVTTDILGNIRVYDTFIDLGAYEIQSLDKSSPTYSIKLSSYEISSNFRLTVNFNEPMNNSSISINIQFEEYIYAITSGNWIDLRTWVGEYSFYNQPVRIATVFVSEAYDLSNNQITQNGSIPATFSVLVNHKQKDDSGVTTSIYVPAGAVSLDVVAVIVFEPTTRNVDGIMPSWDKIASENISIPTILSVFDVTLVATRNDAGKGHPTINSYVEITIEVPNSFTDISRIRIYYFNPSTNIWSDEGITIVSVFGNIITFQTTHLTLFALATVFFDTTAPVVDNIKLNSNSFVNLDFISDSTPTVSFRAIDAGVTSDGIVSYRVYVVDSQGVAISGNDTSVVAVSNNTTINVELKLPLALDDGNYALKIVVTDLANNTVTKTSNLFRLGLSDALVLTDALSAPNPFNPNNEVAHIGYQLNKAGTKIKLAIHSLNGSKIYSDEQTGAIGYNEFTWDGRDQFGQIVKNDVYLAFLITDENGKQIKTMVKIAVIK